MPIQIEHLSYTYAPDSPFERAALFDVNVTIQDGAFIGVMGRTGSGKTTFIHLLAGLMNPTSGRVLLDGGDINDPRYDKTVLRHALGIVFQFPEYQLFETTVERDVSFGLQRMGLSRQEIVQCVREALSMVGLDYERYREQSPMALSGGEKRLVAIAGVLAAKPRYLVFDEPIAGLDPLGRENFLQLVQRLHQGGTTVIMVSHNADCIAEYASRLLVFDDGKLVMDGTPQALFADAERMNALHIGVSEPRYIVELLERAGITVGRDNVRYNALRDRLVSFLKGGAET